jgi:glycosyltransferase involved in cell wall biosynthesis
MKIGIDAFSLNRNDSGIEVYTRELISGLIPGLKVEAYTYSEIHLPHNPNLTIRSSGLRNPGTLRKLKWEISDVSKLVSQDTNVFHSPHFILPYGIPAIGKVVTVHDLAFLRHPEFFDWKTRLYYRLFLDRSLTEADAIICISKSCMNDVAHYFPKTRSKLHLVYHGYKDFGAITQDNEIFDRISMRSPFVLMIGTLNRRKNLAAAVRAFQSCVKTRNMELVIVGSIPKEKFDVNLNDPRIKLTGFISDQELSALYHHAEVLLFPSYYEGFGFPILEAMSAGLPVLTSNTSSIPEVSGYPPDLLCDPGDVDSIEKLLQYFLSDQNKAYLKNHGNFIKDNFSWAKMVAETSAIYELLQKDF